jgi:hypothetical protein
MTKMYIACNSKCHWPSPSYLILLVQIQSTLNVSKTSKFRTAAMLGNCWQMHNTAYWIFRNVYDSFEWRIYKDNSMNRKMRINFMLPSYSCLHPTKKHLTEVGYILQIYYHTLLSGSTLRGASDFCNLQARMSAMLLSPTVGNNKS